MTTLPHLSPARSPTRRPTCPRCSRPLRACLCPWVRPTPNQARVLILQHPLEAGQAKGSATLLRLSLARAQWEVGEQFDEAALQQWLGPPGQAVLLYPATPPAEPRSLDVADATAMRHFTPSASTNLSQLCLVVLDATWRKSRKLLHCNPLLGTLPRLSLQAPPPSLYAPLRKAQQPQHQRSTLEATALALQQLEGDAARYQPLLAAFAGFVAAQGEFAAQS
ncbi:tRNA-uridine aminocarboxypropyltransferase [Ideonella paludis]|uniref:tRNA-uridine aminocarboxypropyltransferase n=1 Tax=Ideonella paludis TaxID=1233411 RepID=A0ABS5DXX2_9BURK|nr:tRNA-uridine aminocarboxypropyltransferase [Ideonella paludis]MBQ0935996.1 DTW domain-containing protein [Ideonella paludis]